MFEAEGNIYWNVESTTSTSFPHLYEVPRKIYRHVEWTDTLDVSLFEESLVSKEFEYQEEETFHFFKDYMVFPRAFSALKKDLGLAYERNTSFYKRRIAEFKTGNGLLYYTVQELRGIKKKS